MLPGVDHGDDIRGGFGSYVNIDAIIASDSMSLIQMFNSLVCSAVCSVTCIKTVLKLECSYANGECERGLTETVASSRLVVGV